MADGAHSHSAIEAALSALTVRVSKIEARLPGQGGGQDEQEDIPGTQEPGNGDGSVEPPAEPPVEMPPSDWHFHALRETFDAADLVALKRVWPVVSYYRGESRIVIEGRETLEYQHTRGLPLDEGQYRLDLARVTRDGVGPWFMIATNTPAGAKIGTFTLDPTGLENGIYFHRVVRPDGRSSPRFPIYIDKGGWFQQDFIPVATAQYDARSGVSLSAIVPANFSPRVTQGKPRKAGPLIDGQTFVDAMIARRNNGAYVPNVDRDGRMGSETLHYYYLSQITSKFPSVPVLDGDYGRAFIPAPTQMTWMHGGGLWIIHPWGFGMVRPDKRFITLAGWRHAGKPVIHSDRDVPGMEPELVGDWSEIIAAGLPVGFHEAWGFYITPKSKIVVNGMHEHNIVILVADTQNNRVLKLEFDRNFQPGVKPCKVTVFIDSLKDPWQIVEGADETEIYVGERHANRIGAYDVDTGAFKYWVVDCSDQMHLMHMAHGETSARFAAQGIFHARPQPTVAQLRSHALIWGEGMANWTDDGRKWVYVASAATNQVLRFERKGNGERQVVISDLPDAGFLNLTICQDDSVYPNGTLLVSNWDNNGGGQPDPYSQRGERLPRRFGLYGSFCLGRARSIPDCGYGAASCVGDSTIGQWGLAFAGSYGGVIRVSPAMEDDHRIPAADIEIGFKEYNRRGYKTLYGLDGNTEMHSLPLPWGEDVKIDAYLMSCGHSRP